MTRQSPIAPLHTAADAVVSHYASPDAPDAGAHLVQTYGAVELEYAAVRKACGLIDLPQRATIVITGADRMTFLNSMLTQELKGLPAWAARRSFWLNRKGRIDADVRLINLPDRVILDVDILAAARTVETLTAFVITEDVTVSDATSAFHRLALHGPASLTTLRKFSQDAPETIEPDTAREITIADAKVIADRWDSTGEVGIELLMPVADTERVYRRLLEAAHEPMHADRVNASPMLRPIGWAAYNIARIEAGTPLYNLDFGPDSLPGETSLLDDRVSFKKGCYLGQEVVARMNALGKPKRRVVALRISDPQATHSTAAADASADAHDLVLARLPDTGAPVFTADAKPGAEPIGAVTSATLAPMLARSAIALATVKWTSGEPGASLLVECEGALLGATVQPTLRFVVR